MILRYLVAIVGGLAITVTMLIGMSHFAAMFRERTGDHVFLIDVLKMPKRGRPDRPGAAALPPGREVERLGNGDVSIPLGGIEEPGAITGPESSLPELEPPAPD